LINTSLTVLLEKWGMINRKVIPEKPPKTIYSLTGLGKSIIPVLDAMCSWGEGYLEREAVTPCCAAQKQG